MTFTHYWVTDFGWENTIFQPTDFKEVEKLGESKEGIVYLGIADNNKKHILLDDTHSANK
jgi:hypothetical protein